MCDVVRDDEGRLERLAVMVRDADGDGEREPPDCVRDGDAVAVSLLAVVDCVG